MSMHAAGVRATLRPTAHMAAVCNKRRCISAALPLQYRNGGPQAAENKPAASDQQPNQPSAQNTKRMGFNRPICPPLRPIPAGGRRPLMPPPPIKSTFANQPTTKNLPPDLLSANRIPKTIPKPPPKMNPLPPIQTVDRSILGPRQQPQTNANSSKQVSKNNDDVYPLRPITINPKWALQEKRSNTGHDQQPFKRPPQQQFDRTKQQQFDRTKQQQFDRKNPRKETHKSEKDDSVSADENVFEVDMTAFTADLESGHGQLDIGRSVGRERDRERRELLQQQKQRKWESKLAAQQEQAKKSAARNASKPRDIHLYDGITIANLSTLMNLRYERLAATMKSLGFENVDADYVINADTASLIVLEHDMNPVIVESQIVDLKPRPLPEDWSTFPLRPPVVTIMGHVDHGKTTLLDSLRKTSVAANEAGGITQHIGAFSVIVPSSGRRITFLDTPGHAAFSAMRSRGAQTTDIVVLVVAADDGVMPQTVEAIKHAQAANVPIIVALNKCDKPGVRMQETKDALLQAGIHVEEYGGEVPAVPVSGLTGKGLDDLEETILAVSEVLDMRGDPSGHVEAFVIEARLSRERGNVTTVLVRRGTLKSGAVLVAGNTYCKVRRLVDENGKEVDAAGPSMPVEITGWKELPQAGDLALQADNEHHAKQVVQSRRRRAEHLESIESIKTLNEKRQRDKAIRSELAAAQKGASVEKRHEEEASKPELRLVVKADVRGSLEAIEGIIQGLPCHEIVPKMVLSGIGPVTESDIDMASASGAQILAFNVACNRSQLAEAATKSVKIHQHNIIYNLIDLVKEMMIDLLPPVSIEEVQGEAEIQQIFHVTLRSKTVEPVAGCKITNGKIQRSHKMRVVRNRQTVYTGSLKTFKHHKKDILEASKGLECGMALDGFTDYRVGDVIQAFKITEKRRTTL